MSLVVICIYLAYAPHIQCIRSLRQIVASDARFVWVEVWYRRPPSVTTPSCTPFDAPGGFWVDWPSWQLKRRSDLARWRRSRQPRLLSRM